MGLDYLFVGLYTIFLPNLFGTSSSLTINTSQTLITIGLFSLFITRDTKKYDLLLWVLVIQQIGNILVHIYQLIYRIDNYVMNMIIIIINTVYLVAILILKERQFNVQSKNLGEN